MSAFGSLPSFEDSRARLAGPDLARCIAILSVLTCHDGMSVLSWWHRSLPAHLAYLGFYGVMLFFVLSGFLIGTIMVDLLEANASLRGWSIFLARRWLRTLPAYYAWLLLVLVPLAYLGPYGVTWEGAKRILPFYLSMTQNLMWGPVSNWYGVSWSLGVEEWFYLCFPALLLMLLALGLRPVVAFRLVLSLLFLLPLTWRLCLPRSVNWDEITSKVVFCRLDSIAWGVAMAALYRRFEVFSRWSGSLLVVGLLLVVAVWWSDRLPIPFGSDFFRKMTIFDFSGFGFALCLPAMMQVVRLPSWLHAPVRTLSTHSYPLYLCHLPILLLAGDLQVRHGLGRGQAVLFTVLATVIGAGLSWRLIERPCLKLRPRQSS